MPLLYYVISYGRLLVHWRSMGRGPPEAKFPTNQPTHPMKTLVLSAALALSLVSCANGPRAQTGTVVGGLTGAAAGGIIGSQSGRGLEGAAIGAGLGAAAGNTLGNAQDQRAYDGRRRY